jgi:hypothetical protein
MDCPKIEADQAYSHSGELFRKRIKNRIISVYGYAEL